MIQTILKFRIIIQAAGVFTLLLSPALSYAHNGVDHDNEKTTTVNSVPLVYTTHTGSGDWLPYWDKMSTATVSQSTTWSAFAATHQLSDKDVLNVPEGVTLTIDTTTPWIHTIVVDGKLNFSTTTSTELKVGTLVVNTSGNLEIKNTNPQKKSVITFGGYTPFDPSEISLGLISYGGAVTLNGAPVVGSFSKIAVKKGATSVTLPLTSKWKVGDEVIFSDSQSADATHWSYSHYNLSLITALPQQWEKRKITKVSGSVITLDKALAYDHSDYMANITRNVVLRSNPETLSDTKTSTRGHIMLMHDTNVNIKNAAFVDLGRTNALHDVDTTTYDENGSVVRQGTNILGRYALHFHRIRKPFLVEGSVITGSEVHRNLNNTTERAIFGSPRWGIVNHDSFGNIRNNVVVGVAGSGIVGEDGTETGTVTGNLVIGTGQGTGGGDDGRFSPLKGKDLGYGGFGYWFRGPFLEVNNNIATGYFKQGGFGYFLHPEFSKSQLPNVAGMPAEFQGKNINVNSQGIRSFQNNTAIGLFGDAPFVMFYTSSAHNLDKFTALNRNTKGNGLDVEYTEKLTLRNSNIKGMGGNGIYTNKETKSVVTETTPVTGFTNVRYVIGQ